MHYNTLFQDRNLKKKFLGRDLSTGEGKTPPQTPPTQRLRRLDRRAFGSPHLALGFVRLVFSVPIVGNPNCD